MFIDNHSQAGTGIVPVIPNYTETQMGIYGIGKYNYSKGGIEAGIRFDGQETRASGYDWTGSLYGGTRKFNNVSYSLERSYKWISSISYSNKVFSARMDGYLQWISGYIYDEPKKETITVISGVYPVFQYKQTPAFFRGMDFDFHFMPINSWDYHLIASFIRANEQTTGNYLPYIPSSRFSHDLSWLHETKSHSKLRLSIRHRFVAKQTRFDSNTDLIPYTPPAYHLLGFAASFECPVKYGYKLQFMIAADNILNKEYKEYTNRSRYYAHDMGSDVRCVVNWSF